MIPEISTLKAGWSPKLQTSENGGGGTPNTLHPRNEITQEIPELVNDLETETDPMVGTCCNAV